MDKMHNGLPPALRATPLMNAGGEGVVEGLGDRQGLRARDERVLDVVREKAVGREQILKAQQTLNEYKKGKANLEQRIIEDEQWYKLRHWECLRREKQQVEPVSGWLFNALANKHADAMDNFPAPNILPRQEDDRVEADALTSIVPVILQQNDFEETYDEVIDYKLKKGTGIYGVFWDKGKLGGLGDIAVRKCDILNLFWESGITDIQQSRNLFHVELQDNELLEDLYPQLKDRLSGPTVDVSRYVYDDSVDTTGKSAVVDWYYKKHQGGKTVLHYVKFVNDVVLYATENETEPVYDQMGNMVAQPLAVTGLYDHGMYPFVFDRLFKVEGTPCGFGYIDIGKSAQEYIDRGNQGILENLLANVRPRYLIREDGEIDEKEYADQTKDFVHYKGQLGPNDVIAIQGKPLGEIYVNVVQGKVDELKEVTGNRDISTGGTTSGVTAASAIAAMQEAGSKLSRDSNRAGYRAFRKVCLMVIELIRQFYDVPRFFRILGERGAQRFVQYSNAGIRPQHQGNDLGMDMGYRVPLFDIEVTASKQSPYSKLSQNEMALQFYGAGFFDPQMADQALACLEMMDFDRKQFVMNKIAQNGTMYQQLVMMQQQLAQLAQVVDPKLAASIVGGMQVGGGRPMVAPTGGTPESLEQTEGLGGEEGPKEHHSTKEARKRVAESTAP